MLENPKIVRGSSAVMLWIYAALVLGVIYGVFRWFLPDGQYIVQLPEIRIAGAAIAALVVYSALKATVYTRSHDALRQAAARGDDTRTETVIAVANTQVYHLPLHVSRTIAAKSIVIASLIFAIFGMLCLGVVWYFGLSNWIVTHHLPSPHLLTSGLASCSPFSLW